MSDYLFLKYEGGVCVGGGGEEGGGDDSSYLAPPLHKQKYPKKFSFIRLKIFVMASWWLSKLQRCKSPSINP